MPKKTDIEKVRETAVLFAYVNIEPNPRLPFIVSHPYVEASPILVPGKDGEPNLLDPINDSAGWAAYRESIIDRLRGFQTPIQFFLAVSKAYRFTFMDHVSAYLDDGDLAECLRCIWINGEHTNDSAVFTKRRLASLWRRANKDRLMDRHERGILASLPDVVTIYRGTGERNGKDPKVFSWTISRERAEWFARRFGGSGHVFSAGIDKDGIFAYFDGEQETVVDPYRLQGIRDAT